MTLDVSGRGAYNRGQYHGNLHPLLFGAVRVRPPQPGCRWCRLSRQRSCTTAKERDQTVPLFLFGAKEGRMAIRGVRGATPVAADEPQAIFRATRELLKEIMEQNAGM